MVKFGYKFANGDRLPANGDRLLARGSDPLARRLSPLVGSLSPVAGSLSPVVENYIGDYMKKIMYLCEILIYVCCIIASAMHWHYLFQNDYSKGTFFHVAAFIAYGGVIIFCIVQLFSKYEPVPARVKNGILILFGGCMLLMAAFVLSFLDFAFPIILTAVSLVLFFVATRYIRGKAFLKFIITFIILVGFLEAAAFLLGLANSSPVNISKLTDAEIHTYNLKMFLKSVGGAATYYFIPVIIAFRYADYLTDEMILENKE